MFTGGYSDRAADPRDRPRPHKSRRIESHVESASDSSSVNVYVVTDEKNRMSKTDGEYDGTKWLMRYTVYSPEPCGTVTCVVFMYLCPGHCHRQAFRNCFDIGIACVGTHL